MKESSSRPPLAPSSSRPPSSGPSTSRPPLAPSSSRPFLAPSTAPQASPPPPEQLTTGSSSGSVEVSCLILSFSKFLFTEILNLENLKYMIIITYLNLICL